LVFTFSIVSTNVIIGCKDGRRGLFHVLIPTKLIIHCTLSTAVTIIIVVIVIQTRHINIIIFSLTLLKLFNSLQFRVGSITGNGDFQICLVLL